MIAPLFGVCANKWFLACWHKHNNSPWPLCCLNIRTLGGFLLHAKQSVLPSFSGTLCLIILAVVCSEGLPQGVGLL